MKQRTNAKGISLIILVITIVVIIIIAGTIIVSVLNSNIISQAKKAVSDTNFAQLKESVSLANMDYMITGQTGSLLEYIKEWLVSNNILKEEELINYAFDNEGNVYKYDDEIELAGINLSIDNTYDNSISYLKISGKSEQVITTQGKNLLDVNSLKNISNWETGYTYRVMPMKVIAGQTYTYSVSANNSEGNQQYLVFSKVKGTGVASEALAWVAHSTYYVTAGRIKYTFTIPAGVTEIYLNWYADGSFSQTKLDYLFDSIIPDFQLEFGNTATAYSAFIPNSPSIEYPSAIKDVSNFNLISTDGEDKIQTINFAYVLRSLTDGTKDYIEIDNINKTVKLVQNIKEILLNGTESWFKNSDSGDFISFYLPKTNYEIISSITVQTCTHALFMQWAPPAGDYWWNATSSVGMRINKSYIERYGYISSMTNQEKINCFKSWLAAQYDAGTPVIIQYKLALPVVTNLDYEEVKSYLTHTNIYTNSIIQPTMEAKLKVIN